MSNGVFSWHFQSVAESLGEVKPAVQTSFFYLKSMMMQALLGPRKKSPEM